jgi:phosphonate transport system substrate-binding protein
MAVREPFLSFGRDGIKPRSFKSISCKLQPPHRLGENIMFARLLMQSRRNFLASAAAFVLAVVSVTVHAAPADARPLLLGVFPHLSAGQIESLFSPFAEYISRQIGRPVQLRTKPTFDDFTNEIEQQHFDIAFLQPLDYPDAHDKFGYQPLARRNELLDGVFVVRPDSPLQSLKDLKGKKIALPPKVAAVSYLAKMELMSAGIDPVGEVTLAYQKAHDACLNELQLMKADACVSTGYPIRFFENKWNVKFRVLAKTRTIPSAVFVAHQRLAAPEREAIANAILSWQETAEGKRMLENNSMTTFVPASDAEYDAVRKIPR